ncbi:polysaccharide deacetylase family protein [Metasolibacillus meyeri]|uniref:Polysaccharide deacetylase family protein n=1 Tax=Metasolibacillus meyeri TaxID=1071052 RepID=A0AAW9NPH2_9BACL|nr:polysaccharide deacetylase family protein [Metasolibacillus meyeri]MEC1179572.1 polysaccharide deacetylase family protein [Metasolibacillus meyeri]
MVRKIYMNGLLLVGLIILIIVIYTKWTSFESEAFAQELLIEEREFITLQERQPMYMRDATFIKIGELEANQPFAISGEDEAYFELRLGKVVAFVSKEHATVKKSAWHTHNSHTIHNAAIKTLQKATVYGEADLQSAIIMYLEEGYRYPIVQEEKDWYIIKIGERLGYVYKQAVTLDEGLPVLVYHHILPKSLMKTTASTISLEAFEQQMDYLADNKFKTLTANQLYDYLEGRLVVPANTVLITFDDGLLSTKEYAYPILQQHGFTAIQHIISSRTNRAHGEQAFDAEGPLQFFTNTDLAELTDVFHFEAHTHDLHSLNEGLGIAFERSKEEIIRDLQQNIEQVPNAISLAYPYGHYNESFITAAKEAGLLIAFTTQEGYANMNASNYEVCRFGVTEKKSFEQFTTYINGNMVWQ